MTMINKEKVLKGVGKAVDAANNAADKAAAFAKEKELDKKAKNMAHSRLKIFLKIKKILLTGDDWWAGFSDISQIDVDL